MADFETYLTRWQTDGIRWQVIAMLILGAILLACGVALFVSAHWDKIGPGARFAVVLGMVSVFHLGGSWARKRFRVLSTALHAVGTLSTGAAIALVGQIFNIQEHWPAAVLLWALAALAGWILLRDEAQQTLTLLLFPAWLLSEFTYYAEGHIGENVYQGRFLIVWAVLYLTFFLGSRRKIVQRILFAAGAIASIAGIVILLDPWRVWETETYLSLGMRTWGWVDIAAIPLLFALFKFRKSMIPVVVAICFSIALPWCQRNLTITGQSWIGDGQVSYSRSSPNLAAHALVAAFAVFIIWWGVRQTSQALVNLVIVGFVIAVGWFYFSDIMHKLDRSLGLIGLGVLFLAGGWALEKMRRKLVAGMGKAEISEDEEEL